MRVMVLAAASAPPSGPVPIGERVTGPALADSDEEAAPRFGHQQFLRSPAQTFTYN